MNVISTTKGYKSKLTRKHIVILRIMFVADAHTLAVPPARTN